MLKGIEAPSKPSESESDAGPRKDALAYLQEWLLDRAPYCALLGEYGMGKTTTCKALVRLLLDQRAKGQKVPRPIYLDLKSVGENAKDGLPLEKILDLILERTW